ncbi:hypothetical protein LguiA_011462 [Lonicera macranthoides]
MATLPLSFTMGSHCLSSGAIESSKLGVATHSTYGKRVSHNLGQINLERNLVYREIAKPATENFYMNSSLKVLATARFSAVQTATEVSTYLFKSEIGSQVKVFVEKKIDKYGVTVEVSPLQTLGGEEELVMTWGIFRSDSSSFLPLDYQNSGLDSKSRTIDSRFVQKSFDKHTVELDFEASLTPFSISFLLKSSLEGDSKISEIRSQRKTSFCVPVGFGRGYPAPLGLSFSSDDSMNFALFSRSAEGVVLCLYDNTTKNKPALEIELDPYVNRSGDIWHASIDSDLPLVGYGYRCKRIAQEKVDNHHADQVLLDPYAKVIGDYFLQGLGQLCMEPAFDWSGDIPPCLPMEELVVYRLNVMHFTKDKSSKLPGDSAGTFSGIAEKLHHFQDLGVNAVLLEPVFPFDEQKGPYFPCHFFSPTSLYGSSASSLSAIKLMKEMVKRLHASGIEVLLEVVYTHTAEGGALRGIDDPSYYYEEGRGLGISDTLKCNYPIVQQMILDSLRHWVIEFRVDGFCFINSYSLLRGVHGENLSRPPLVEAISFDPILSKVKIIADYFDPHDMPSKEIQFPHWKRWAEINTKFCEDVRNYLRGEGLLSNLATRLCGSGDIFLAGRGPAFSFNFIARNFGLPLVDLVSFSNSELTSQLSWNCGEEGATNNTEVLETRLKQIRNFLFILFVSLGVPVLNMGDECGQSSGGLLECDRKPFNWDALRTGFATQTMQFISFLSSLRIKRRDLLQKRNYLKVESIDWHGSDDSPPSWEDPTSKFLAMTLKADKEVMLGAGSSCPKGDLFVAFNAAEEPEIVTLPAPPTEMVWLRLVDTALPYPRFFSMDGEAVAEEMPEMVTYEMKSHSCVLFEARYISVLKSE